MYSDSCSNNSSEINANTETCVVELKKYICTICTNKKAVYFPFCKNKNNDIVSVYCCKDCFDKLSFEVCDIKYQFDRGYYFG